MDIHGPIAIAASFPIPLASRLVLYLSPLQQLTSLPDSPLSHSLLLTLPHTVFQRQQRSPTRSHNTYPKAMSTQHSPIHPGSGYASPAGSVLLPPIEIEVSPAHSYRSSSSFRRHYSDDSSSDESDSKSRDPPPTATATTMQAGNTRTSNTFTKTFSAETSSSVMSFSRKGEVEEYENNPHLYGPGMLQRSGSKQSITLKEYGRWGQLRRSPNFILFTVFLALFVDMATVRELERRLFFLFERRLGAYSKKKKPPF